MAHACSCTLPPQLLSPRVPHALASAPTALRAPLLLPHLLPRVVPHLMASRQLQLDRAHSSMLRAQEVLRLQQACSPMALVVGGGREGSCLLDLLK